jgi:hypothetical protein
VRRREQKVNKRYFISIEKGYGGEKWDEAMVPSCGVGPIT